MDNWEHHVSIPAGYLYLIFSFVSDFINSLARIYIMNMTLGFEIIQIYLGILMNN